MNVRELLDGVRRMTREDLLEVLTQRFDDNELRDLCFTLDVDYENLRGETKDAKARELLLRMERRGEVDKLAKQVQRERPER